MKTRCSSKDRTNDPHFRPNHRRPYIKKDHRYEQIPKSASPAPAGRRRPRDATVVNINQAAIDKAAAQADADDKRSLGSFKLDWLQTLMSAYPEIDHATYRVAACIAFTVNQASRYARISSQTIADKTGVKLTKVKAARTTLRDHGWLVWKRTRDANLYKLISLERNVSEIDDRQTICRDRRNEARKSTQKRFREGCPRDHLAGSR